MEDRKLNEKESLELIAQMIRNTRRNLDAGGGNMFLLWGYLSLITAMVVWVLVWMTGNIRWNWLWFAMPLIGFPIQLYFQRKKPTRVLTYTDRMLITVWGNVSGFGACVSLFLGIESEHAVFILPLMLLFVALGVGITGEIIKDKWMKHVSALSLGIVLAALSGNWVGDDFRGYLLLMICIIILMIIPGHRLNRKERKSGICNGN